MANEGISAPELPERLRMHLDADTDHSEQIWQVFVDHVRDEESFDQVVRGARESLDIYRTFKRAVVEGIAEYEAARATVGEAS
jgi:hypothetical protein